MKNQPRRQLFKVVFVPLLFFFLALIYLFPLVQGHILLPLDLLINNYTPWYNPGTILLKNSYMQDSIVQLFPWRHLVFQSLTHGIIPLWNPYQQLGMPFMASLKPMVFYPLNIFFLFGEIKAWNLLLFAQIFLAMLFAYYLARDFKIKLFPCLLTSFAFGLNSYMIGLLEFGSDAHTIIWWPLLILFAKRFIDKQQRRYLFLFGLTLSFSIFAGQLQYLGYFMLLFTAFLIFYGLSAKAKISTYVLLLAGIILGVGISAVQLFPSFELFHYSHRGLLSSAQNSEIFSKGLMAPQDLLRLFSPDFFGNPVSHDLQIGYIETSGYFGIIPLFFAFFAIFFARKQKIVQFLTLAFLLSLFFSLQGVGQILYLLKIPLITSGGAQRIFTLVLFTGALLSGFGLSEFIAIKSIVKKSVSVLLFLVMYFLSISGYLLLLKYNQESSPSFLHNINFSTIIVGVFFIGYLCYAGSLLWIKKWKYFEYGFLLLVVGVTFFDLFRMGYRFLTYSNQKFLYPEMNVTKFIQNASQEDLGRTFGLTEPDLGTYLHIYSTETYNPLYPLRSTALLQSLQNLSLNDLPQNDNKYFLTSTGDHLKKTLDFIGAEYIVVGKDDDPSLRYFHTIALQGDFRKLYSDDRYAVYKNSQVFPRFALYYQAVIIKDDKETLDAISNGKLNLRDNLILAQNIPVVLRPGIGSVKQLATTVNTQKFQIDTTTPALFYLSDTFYPGWQANINKQSTPIYRANYNFRAVLVPAGKSILEFNYLPTSFIVGMYVSIGSTILLLLLWIVPVKKIRV